MRGKRNEQPRPMKEPAKRHGDTINPDKRGEKKPDDEMTEAERKLLEPEREGGIGGP
jgi:hypothetical protein